MVFGYCLCEEDVTGDNCTDCKEGMFGAPDLLIECKPCPCVNIANPVCHLDSSDMVSAICDNCGPAYDGQYCELCANGYYRNKSVRNKIMDNSDIAMLLNVLFLFC